MALGLIIRKKIGDIESEIELPYEYSIVNNKPRSQKRFSKS